MPRTRINQFQIQDTMEFLATGNANDYLFFGSANLSGNASADPTRLVFVPRIFTQERTFTTLAVNCTGALAGSTIRLGIYNADQLTGMPTSLVVDAGTASTATTGVKSITGLSALLSRGLYFVAFSGSSASVSVSAMNNILPSVLGYDFSALSYIHSRVITGWTYGSLPTNVSSGFTFVNGTTTANDRPFVGIR